MTAIETLLGNEDLLVGLMSMSGRRREDLVEEVREEKFSFMWERTDMTREEALEEVKKTEEVAVENHGNGGVHDDIVRLEVHDVMITRMHERFVEEGVIEKEE